MRKFSWYLLFAFLVVVSRSISCNPLRLSEDLDGGVPDDIDSTGGLNIKPVNPTIDITIGIPATPLHFTAKTLGGADVTALAAWTIDDPTLGDIQAGILTPAGDKGGQTTIHAIYGDVQGITTVKIKLHATISDACPGCPAFPPPNAPSCGDGARKPRLVYPPDGPLIPPNMNVIQTQFDKGAANSLFEVVFANAATDVRVTTRCTAITDMRNIATSGCSYDLSQMVWDVLIKTNRGGDPIDITVRATDDGGSCVASSDTNSIKIAMTDLVGGIYYWQSITNMGMPGRGGGIYRYDFGKRNQPPDAFLDAATQGRCIGCHFLSRDGQQMTYGADDADDDDEYGDLSSLLIQVAKKVAISGQTSPGFQSFSPDHKLIIASDGRGEQSPPAFSLLDGETHGMINPPIPTGGQRGTHPDWSPDGKSIVYVQPKKFLAQDFGDSYDDDHFTGGSLMTMTVDIPTKTFGAPTPLLPSSGENNFYPAFSPDGQFVMFNTVPGTGSDIAQDNFYNINARVSLLSLRPGSTPVDMAALNGGMQGYTNSWPRFCPLVQKYKGHTIAWVAFSSTRDYGFKVRNSVQVPSGGKMIDQINCYPPYSPENTGGFGNQAANCHQPQLWMGAIDLTMAAGGEAGGLDASFSAFWLPFQDLNSHNHTAQWVTTIVTEPPPDGGCVDVGNTCSTATGPCCNGNACIDNTCQVP